MTVIHNSLPQLLRHGLLVLLVACGGFAVASPASARLNLASTSPEAGTTAAGPLDQITLVFMSATSSSIARRYQRRRRPTARAEQ